MSRGTINGTAFLNKPLNTFIEMKATFAIRTVREMLLHNNDFLNAEFSINVEMKTSNSFIAAQTVIHDTSPPALARLIFVSVYININIGTFIPGVIRIYCYKTSQK